MKKNKTIYQDISEWGDIDEFVEITQDFLPKPKDLVFKQKLKTVTITLDEESISFYKKKADKLSTSYQHMIQNLLHTYAKRMLQKK